MLGSFGRKQRSRQLGIPFGGLSESLIFYALLSAGLLSAIVCLPLLAHTAVQDQFERFEKRAVLSYARAVINRSDRVSVTVRQAFAALDGIAEAELCSPKSIAGMQAIVLASSDIEIVGYERGGRLVCSSLGTQLNSIPLGAISFTGQYQVRRNVHLEFARATPFNVLEQNGWVIFIPQLQPIDVSTPQGVVLATYSTLARQVRTSVGAVPPEWIAREGAGQETTFFDSGYVIGLVRSKAYPAGAIAAMPLQLFEPVQSRVTWITTGIALLAGLSLSAWLLYLAKRQRIISPVTLKRALHRNELYLAYQPIVDLKTRQWVGAEALMRWRRADVEIPPEVFFPVVEEFNLEGDFTDRLFLLIAQDSRLLFSGDNTFYISLNVTAADIRRGCIVERLSTLSKECGVSSVRFKVEITERRVLDERIDKTVIDEIHAIGMDTVVDDFGTGFSNLNYLSLFNFDYLKMDKAFVSGIGAWSTASAIALHIIALAKSLDIGVIAEGVENEQQAQALADHGIQFAQGWYFSKPRTAQSLVGDMGAVDETLSPGDVEDSSPRRAHQ